MVDSVPYTESYYAAEFVGYGGQTLFIHESIVRLEGLEVRLMGQGGRMGRYPVVHNYSKLIDILSIGTTERMPLDNT
jgi:hypothetical protein